MAGKRCSEGWCFCAVVLSVCSEMDSNICVFSRDFLPRGSGIVTRRPLVLQLVSANTGEVDSQIAHRVRSLSISGRVQLTCSRTRKISI